MRKKSLTVIPFDGSCTSIEQLCTILKSWAFNMKKIDGTNYKECVVKVMWNITAKMLQEFYLKNYNISFDPFKDIQFKSARDARNSKRRELQQLPQMRKSNACALLREDIVAMCTLHDLKTPDGLQRRFYHIASYELAWRGGEASKCLVSFFTNEKDNCGKNTGRLVYNTVFSKTAQGGSKKLTDHKWLTPNQENADICPVKLYNELLFRRSKNITTDRLFLTPNPAWKMSGQWYKNCPVGANTVSKWTQEAAKRIGLDTKRCKITNHSNRALRLGWGCWGWRCWG